MKSDGIFLNSWNHFTFFPVYRGRKECESWKIQESLTCTGRGMSGQWKKPNGNTAPTAGGRVVIVADTEAERQAAKKVKGALILDSYDAVVDAILK